MNRLVLDEEMGMYLKLYTLLYADDTVILAETENELQDTLTALEEYCKLWSLTVNLDKTKIIIFSRGLIRKHRNFTYAGEIIEVVREYIYLGVTLSYNNSFNNAINRQVTLARKAHYSFISKVNKLNLPLDIQLKLFDKLIVPILTYGCEVWGISNLSKIELFHRKFIKSASKVSKYTANSIIYGETGRNKISNIIYERMIKYWLKVKQGNSTKLSVILFRLMRELYDKDILKSKWCAKIHEIFNNLGLSFIWNLDVSYLNPRHLKVAVKQRISDISKQEWSAAINENPLCINFRLIKTKFEFEEYLLLEDQYRIPLSKFRCGSHNLPISLRRYDPIDERNLCSLCNLDTGDELHYVLKCPGLDIQRKHLIAPYFYNNPNVIKFNKLFSLTSKIKLRKLSRFVKLIMYIFRPDEV